MTNATADGDAAVEATDVPQFRDEYERATTAQVGDHEPGRQSGTTFGARNVSHRVSPALLPDGHVAYTEWRHLGDVNDGHLRLMNADMTGMREAFGGEDGGNGGTNSYLKARYVQTTSYQLASGETVRTTRWSPSRTSRDRTLQAGKLLLVDLNGSEENSSCTDLTPLVPGDNAPEPGRPLLRRRAGRPPTAPAVPGLLGGRPRRVRDAGASAHSNAQFGLY